MNASTNSVSATSPNMKKRIVAKDGAVPDAALALFVAVVTLQLADQNKRFKNLGKTGDGKV